MENEIKLEENFLEKSSIKNPEVKLEVNKAVKTNDVPGENKGAAAADSFLSALGKSKEEKPTPNKLPHVNALTVRVQKIHEDAVMPKYVHEGDSGMDLFSVAEHVLKPGERQLIGTGLKVAVPLGYEGQVRPKSGLALKHGVTVVNTPGTLDAGYRGKLGVIAINHGAEDYKVEKNQKIAQLVIQKIEQAHLEEVQSLDETSRGEGGFGSTGLNK